MMLQRYMAYLLTLSTTPVVAKKWVDQRWLSDSRVIARVVQNNFVDQQLRFRRPGLKITFLWTAIVAFRFNKEEQIVHQMSGCEGSIAAVIPFAITTDINVQVRPSFLRSGFDIHMT